MSAQDEEIKLKISETVRSVMEKRYIYETHVKRVIEWAEAAGNKLYQPEMNKYLAKRRAANVTFYVIYSPSPEGYIVHTTYSHRAEIVEEG